MKIETIEKYITALKNEESIDGGTTVVTGITVVAPNISYSIGDTGIGKYNVDIKLDKAAGELVLNDHDGIDNDKDGFSKILVFPVEDIVCIRVSGRKPKAPEMPVSVEIV